MCYYRLSIYTTCGHPRYGRLVAYCARCCLLSSMSSKNEWPQVCPNQQHHPYHTLRFHSLCPACAQERARSLRALDMDDAHSIHSQSSTRRPQFAQWKGMNTLRSEMKEKALAERGRIPSIGFDRFGTSVNVGASTSTSPANNSISTSTTTV